MFSPQEVYMEGGGSDPRDLRQIRQKLQGKDWEKSKDQKGGMLKKGLVQRGRFERKVEMAGREGERGRKRINRGEEGKDAAKLRESD